MFLITLGPSSDRRRQVEKPKGKLNRSDPLHQCQMESGVELIADESMPNKQSKRGIRALSEQKPQAKLIPGRPLVKRLAAKRHHDPGKSGQRHRDLGGRRQGFTGCIAVDWIGFSRREQTRSTARVKTNAALILSPTHCRLAGCGNLKSVTQLDTQNTKADHIRL